MGRVYGVILAGGSGTRFWPLSRTARPKQFLALASRKPLLKEAVDRLQGLAPLSRTLFVCGAAHAGPIRKALKGIPAGNVLVEPAPRNTAPAIALAALEVLRRDPSGRIVVLASDQHIADPKAFRRGIEVALKAALNERIVTLGIPPTRPDTGFGYIRAAPGLGARAVEAFVEKPDRAKAASYVAEGNYLWNAGIFVFAARTMIAAMATHLPQVLEPLRAAWPNAAKVKRAFSKMQPISIDFGVMEKARNVDVVACNCGWSDLGSFEALPGALGTDRAGNLLQGKGAVGLDLEGCVVIARDRPVVVVGMRDVVVVDAGDAVLVIPKNRSQDVRRAVEALRMRGFGSVL